MDTCICWLSHVPLDNHRIQQIRQFVPDQLQIDFSQEITKYVSTIESYVREVLALMLIHNCVNKHIWQGTFTLTYKMPTIV